MSTLTRRPPVTLTLSDDEVVGGLLALAGANPSKTYRSPAGDGVCVNFDDDDNPSCIVGHLLAMHGVTAEDLTVWDGTNLNMVTAKTLVTTGLLDVSENALGLLMLVQSRQDRGERWSFAVAEALVSVQILNEED